EDLLDSSRLQPGQHPQDETILIGTVNEVYPSLSVGDPISRRIYLEIRDSQNFGSQPVEETRERGIERALKTPYAFVQVDSHMAVGVFISNRFSFFQERLNNELAVDEHCELTHLVIENPEQKSNPEW